VRGSVFGVPRTLTVARGAGSATLRAGRHRLEPVFGGNDFCLFRGMGQGVRRFEDLRCWQAAYRYKKVVYDLCEQGSLAADFKLRDQLMDSVAGPPSHIAEGYGRFNPVDSSKFAGYARASLMESQNHLRDAVDRRHITEEQRLELNVLAEAALAEVTGWLDYLRSPEALRKAREARERRAWNREPRTTPPEPRTANPEPRTPNREPRTANPEPNREHEPGTGNAEPRTTLARELPPPTRPPCRRSPDKR
jgi:four helix bundle protein